MTAFEVSALLLSLKAAAVSLCINLPLAVLLSVIFIYCSFPGKRILENFLYIPLVLPPVVTGYILLLLLNSNSFIGRFFYDTFNVELAFSSLAPAIAASVVSFPLVFRPVKLAVSSIDNNYIMIARSLGASWTKIFFRILIPMSFNGLVSGAVLGFARSMGEFGATIMLAGNIPYKTSTIPLAIYSSFNKAAGETSSLRLIILAIGLSFISIFISEYFTRREANAGN